MKQNKGRISPQQLRMLAIAWFAIVVLVGACTFLAVIFGTQADRGGRTATQQAGAPTASNLPTPTTIVAEGQGVAPQSPEPGPTTPPRQDPSFGYGIQVQAHINTDQTLEQVKQLGMGWIKQQISWKDLEPQPNQANWDALDAIFAATSAHKLRVLVSVTNAPDWARSVTAPGKEGPPDNPQDFVNYISQMLQRYPGAIHAVEVWNEPNLSERGWYAPGGLNSSEYMNLLIPVADAIHQIDPGVIVISAAPAPTGTNDGVIAIDDFVYQQDLIDQGLLDHVDCVGAHANGINMPPDIPYDAGYQDSSASYQGPFANPHHSWSFYSTLTGYHDMIVASGHDTPICVTEFGWPTMDGMQGQPLMPDFAFAFDNTAQEQADNIVNAFKEMDDWGFVWLAFLFNLDYSPKIGGDPINDSTMWSITYPDGSPRPAYDAVRDMPKPP